jgi:hypothetical protein
MSISHVCNYSSLNACTWVAKESRPEVGYRMTLQSHDQTVGNAKDGRDDHYTPDCEFLIFIRTYLE